MPETLACLMKSAAGGNTLVSLRTDSIELIASSNKPVWCCGNPATIIAKSRACPPRMAKRFCSWCKIARPHRVAEPRNKYEIGKQIAIHSGRFYFLEPVVAGAFVYRPDRRTRRIRVSLHDGTGAPGGGGEGSVRNRHHAARSGTYRRSHDRQPADHGDCRRL